LSTDIIRGHERQKSRKKDAGARAAVTPEKVSLKIRPQENGARGANNAPGSKRLGHKEEGRRRSSARGPLGKNERREDPVNAAPKNGAA